MALNLLNFNSKKIEVMVFGSATGTPPVDLGSLAQYIKPNITNLGYKVDPELNLNCQIKAFAVSALKQFFQGQLTAFKKLALTAK